MFNFKDIYALLTNRSACITAENQEALNDRLLELLQNKELATAMSRNSWNIIDENRGAARRNTLELKQLLQ